MVVAPFMGAAPRSHRGFGTLPNKPFLTDRAGRNTENGTLFLCLLRKFFLLPTTPKKPKMTDFHIPNVKIIFITSHIEYAIDAFELSIFRYVPKSDLTNRLVSAVVDAAKLIELEGGKEYIIQTAGRMEKIPYKDIFYIQRDGGKNSMICSRLGISKVRKSLQQVFDELQAQEFIFIDRVIS